MNSLSKHFFLSVISIFILINSVKAQNFYNFDSFINDSAFVIANKIKSVIIRIPTLLDDTTNKEFVPFQKLCFNPFGKLATYEFDFSEKKRQHKDYLEHYYNDTTKQRYKSHRFRRAYDAKTELDTLREEIIYHYDEDNRLFFEEHHQVYISEFNEWTVGYEWYGDTLQIRYAENHKVDTTRFDEKGRISEYTDNDRMYKISYDDRGRKSKMSYFLLNNDATKGKAIGEYSFIYDTSGKLERIETTGHEIVFTYDFMGLLLNSQMRDKKTGQPLGWQVTYEYDYRW